ncbi:2-oxoacid:acceptor oxidoreductase family protein [bacterium]|nr:2-oxoacid:acceptor oxidoreductase family protein [bacterium]
MSSPGSPPELSIGIVGSGGDGVVLLGELLAQSAVAAGLYCYMDKVFGPQIRGGESSAILRISREEVLRSADELDVLLVLQWADLARFSDVLSIAGNALIICSSEDETSPADAGLPAGHHGPVLSLPLKQLALEHGRSKQARNMVLLGALSGLLDWYPEQLSAVLERRMQRYDERSRENNLAAVAAGRDALAGWQEGPLPVLPTADAAPELVLASGNELLARAALASGCRFMAGYPITPASEILEYMNRRLPALGGTCIQAEDEIAAACLTLGAGLGGVRSMSATSGPGMTLKSETIALAGMAGLPLVVVDVQRCGPSTGIPTRTEQADLNLALHGAHGDSPRIVLAAAHQADCAELATQAFELAGRCHAPVILLSEQQLAQGLATLPAGGIPDNTEPSPGWPERSIGSAVQVQLTGLEHDDKGRPLSDAASHEANALLRQARVDKALGSVPALQHGALEAELGLLCWGGSYSVSREALALAAARGVTAGMLCIRMLSPLDGDAVQAWLDRQQSLVIVEMNHSGQLHDYLRSRLDLPEITMSLRRSGGRPWRLAELEEFLVSHGLIPQALEARS